MGHPFPVRSLESCRAARAAPVHISREQLQPSPTTRRKDLDGVRNSAPPSNRRPATASAPAPCCRGPSPSVALATVPSVPHLLERTTPQVSTGLDRWKALFQPESRSEPVLTRWRSNSAPEAGDARADPVAKPGDGIASTGEHMFE